MGNLENATLGIFKFESVSRRKRILLANCDNVDNDEIGSLRVG
jgi:hypothetical protein